MPAGLASGRLYEPREPVVAFRFGQQRAACNKPSSRLQFEICTSLLISWDLEDGPTCFKEPRPHFVMPLEALNVIYQGC